VNQIQPADPSADPRRDLGPGPPIDDPPERRSWTGWLVGLAIVVVIAVAGALVLTGCAAEPVEEVDVADVTEDQPAASREDETVSLTGDVDEILTESALTVTDAQSEEPLLVLLTPMTTVNGTTVTLGGQPGGVAQVIPPEGTLQLVGTIDTFDSATLSEQLGIVLNDELFAPWDGEPVLITQQVETFDPDADAAAATDSP
jgi:hypothetical protein